EGQHSEFNQEEGHKTESSNEQSTDDETYAMAQRFQLIISGLGLLLGSVIAYEIYNNFTYIKKSIFGGPYDLSHFDEAYEEIKRKKSKKEQELEKQTFSITNPNDSSVPGLYICGNNEFGLVSEDPKVKFQTVFKRLEIFDKFLARDVALGQDCGALIDNKGDLYQWGEGFGGDSTKSTLKGHNLTKVAISNGVIYALSSKGEVLYLPESSALQKELTFKTKAWLGSKNTPFGQIALPKKVEDISSGEQHLVLLTSDGEVYTAATGLKPVEKSFGQFGIPSFSQFDTPPTPNEAHEVTLLNKYRENDSILSREIKQVAAGDYFTLCLDNLGYVWAFGKNTYGSVGKEVSYNTEIIPYPTRLELISNHYSKTDFPQCIGIGAGGDTAFATFVSSNIYHLFEKSIKGKKNLNIDTLTDSQSESVTYFAWGHGLKGELGVGHFVHGQPTPTKIQGLNSLKDYNEKSKQIETTGVKKWSNGKNHTLVTLSNNDVYAWGDNEFGQLGNGRRYRSGLPTTLPKLLEPGSNKKFDKTDVNNRLQMKETDQYEQVIVTGPLEHVDYHIFLLIDDFELQKLSSIPVTLNSSNTELQDYLLKISKKLENYKESLKSYDGEVNRLRNHAVIFTLELGNMWTTIWIKFNDSKFITITQVDSKPRQLGEISKNIKLALKLVISQLLDVPSIVYRFDYCMPSLEDENFSNETLVLLNTLQIIQGYSNFGFNLSVSNFQTDYNMLLQWSNTCHSLITSSTEDESPEPESKKKTPESAKKKDPSATEDKEAKKPKTKVRTQPKNKNFFSKQSQEELESFGPCYVTMDNLKEIRNTIDYDATKLRKIVEEFKSTYDDIQRRFYYKWVSDNLMSGLEDEKTFAFPMYGPTQIEFEIINSSEVVATKSLLQKLAKMGIYPNQQQMRQVSNARRWINQRFKYDSQSKTVHYLRDLEVVIPDYDDIPYIVLATHLHFGCLNNLATYNQVRRNWYISKKAVDFILKNCYKC
ncbi:hypothetical protein CANARDRAFT_184662, partial [[Candida] arabinofermentans NRRL YB-2248]